MSIPNPPKSYDQNWAAEFKRQVDRLADSTYQKGSDVELSGGRVVATSPSGNRFYIEVDDEGNLITRAISAELPPPPPPPPPPPALPPVNTVPGAQSVLVSGTITFSGTISVADEDSSALTATVSASAGSLQAVVFAGATITNNNTSAVTISGTPAAINGALNGMVYTAPATAQTVTLQVSTTDGTYSDNDPISVSVTAAPPPPAAAPYYAFGSRKDLVSGKYPYGIIVSHKTAAEMDASIQAKYNAWKNALIVDDPATPGGKAVLFGGGFLTVSEGMGYGMLLAVIMADQTLFDALLRTVRNHPAYSVSAAVGASVGDYLMDWKLWADGTSNGAGWNAMDGDQDIAQALLMADRQWSTEGTTYNYLNEARLTISAMKVWNMKTDGTTKGLGQGHVSRTSDYMTGHFREYAAASVSDADKTFWGTTVIARTAYLTELMQQQFSPVGALMPDFIINTGGELNGQTNPDTGRPYNGPTPSPGMYGDGNDNEDKYFANAQRNPWRWGSDYVYTGDARWYAITEKLNLWIKGKTGGVPGNTGIGYHLDGSSMGTSWPARGLVAGFMNGAQVNGAHQAWVNACWDWCEQMYHLQYYDAELMLLSMIVASGNWWNRTVGKIGTSTPAPPPPPPPPPPAPSEPPVVTTAAHASDWLLTGGANMLASDGYFIADDRWGASGITEGPNPDQYMQEVGRNLVTTADPIAFRTQWRWPAGANEVKGYPGIISGRKPGYESPDHKPAWDKNILLPDGSNTLSLVDLNDNGGTPGTWMPQQLPLTGSILIEGEWKFASAPTGQGQLVFDLWLTRTSRQGFGFTSAPITHEIMIPVCFWGGYGGHQVGTNQRNTNWYDHEAASVGGAGYWMYCTKNLGRNPVGGANDGTYPGLHYNFPSFGPLGLNGSYTNPETGQPAIGWKMIAFVPKTNVAVTASVLQGTFSFDLVPILNYLRTRYDSRGVAWCSGNEWLQSMEFGVEPVVGEGDLTVFNYKVTRS